ncbi:MAG: hypothetical protein AAGJ83_09190, partial [Planctomycetota bacterium]
MPSYTFVARDEQGQLQRGSQQADSPSSLAAAMRARGLKLLRFQEQIERISPFEWLATRLNPLQYIPPRGLDI